MNGCGIGMHQFIQPGGFRHSLGSTSCGGRQQYIHPKGAIGCDDTLSCGGFSGTRTTGKHQDLCSRCTADGLHLHLIIFHIYNFLDFLNIHRQFRITGILSGFHKRNPESVCCRFCSQLFQFICNTYFRKIERRQVDTFLFNLFGSIFRDFFPFCKLRHHHLFTNQFLILQHPIHGHNDAGILRLQKR